MGNILSRINKIAVNEGITITNLEAKIGASKGVLSRALAKGTDIQTKWLTLIVENYPLYSSDWLLMGRGDMLQTKKPIYQEHPNNVYDFVGAGAAGEAMLLLNEDKYRKEPNMYIPELGTGVHIRTPVSGDSMHSTIKDGDKAVSTLITDIKDIRQGYIYAILDKQDGLVYKRLYFDNKQYVLELCSDNEIYRPYTRHYSELSAIFKVREVHTKDLRPYFDDIRKDMRQLKNKIIEIERKLK